MNKFLAGCFVSAVLGALVAIALTRGVDGPSLANPLAAPGEGLRIAPPPAAGAADGLTPDERVNIAVYANANRSVVNINTRVAREDATFPFFEAPREGSGSGSGFVLDKQGHILTNYHVIEDAREVIATLYDGQSYRAQVVGQDPYTDMAILLVEAPQKSLFPVTLGDSLSLQVGQRAIAIGNPMGLERSLTIGIISSLNRTIPTRDSRTIRSIIQTDADINPGSSGGPLLNSRGEVIGMNTAIASKTGQNSGIGFAIPVSAIKRIAPQLIRDGRVIRADSGITRVLETDQGLIIATLATNGPAEKAGLQGFKVIAERRRQGPFEYVTRRVDQSAADRIVAIDGQRVTRADQLLNIVESKKPGEIATFSIVRRGQQADVQVKLEESP